MTRKRKRIKERRLAESNKSTKRNVEIPQGFSTPLMKTFIAQNPFANVDETRLKAKLDEVGRESEERLAQDLAKLDSLIRRHNPEELLATASVYCLCGASDESEELTKEGPYTQHIVELLQSFTLRPSKADFGDEPVHLDYLFRILDLAKAVSKAFSKRRYSNFHVGEASRSGADFAIEMARLQTQAVRNWGHPQHMYRILTELFEPLEDAIASEYGLGALQILAIFDALRLAVVPCSPKDEPTCMRVSGR